MIADSSRPLERRFENEEPSFVNILDFFLLEMVDDDDDEEIDDDNDNEVVKKRSIKVENADRD